MTLLPYSRIHITERGDQKFQPYCRSFSGCVACPAEHPECSVANSCWRAFLSRAAHPSWSDSLDYVQPGCTLRAVISPVRGRSGVPLRVSQLRYDLSTVSRSDSCSEPPPGLAAVPALRRATTVDVSREHIEIVEGASGPKARILGHRVNVEHVVGWYEIQGWSVAKIVEEIPTITPADVHAALAYYWDHKEELEQKWAADAAWVEEFRRTNIGPLDEKLKQRRVG